MSGSVANPDGLKPTKEGPEWRNHFVIGESRGSNMLLECVHCGKGQAKPWTANATRARIHLSSEGEDAAGSDHEQNVNSDSEQDE